MNVPADKLKAALKDGVLEIVIPKTTSQAKKITIS
jgi:HSP20 family molecular chaperone IbpA